MDQFTKENPGYAELSDRKIAEWAVKSNAWVGTAMQGSNDKPNLPENLGARQLKALATRLRRNFVIGELQQNLVAEDRKRILSQFPDSIFKKSAVVLVGEPPATWTAQVQASILADKEAKRQKQIAAKRAEFERKQAQKEKQKKWMEEQKKREQERKERI